MIRFVLSRINTIFHRAEEQIKSERYKIKSGKNARAQKYRAKVREAYKAQSLSELGLLKKKQGTKLTGDQQSRMNFDAPG